MRLIGLAASRLQGLLSMALDGLWLVLGYVVGPAPAAQGGALRGGGTMSGAAHKEGKQALRLLVEALELQALEIRRYAERYEEARSDKDRADLLRCAILYMSVDRVVRLDVTAEAYANLAATSDRQQCEAK